MTIKVFPFASGPGQTVTEADWRDMTSWFGSDGVVRGKLSEFSATPGTGLSVDIAPGHAWFLGHYLKSDATENIALQPADATNPRKDLIVAYVDMVNRAGGIKVLTGTPAASPVAPTVTQTPGAYWEIALWEVDVAAGASSLTASDLTDRRGYAAVGGLSDLTDVDTSGAADGQALVYQASSGLWVPGAGVGGAYSATTRTITIPAGSTAAEIQAILDGADHYIRPGEVVIVQFADGTYTLDQAIYIRGWFGGGALVVRGNPSDPDYSTSYSVKLNGAGTVINVDNTMRTHVTIERLQITTDDTDSYSNAVRFTGGVHATLTDLVLAAGGTSSARVLYLDVGGMYYVRRVYITAGYRGIQAGGAFVLTESVDDLTTQPQYGCVVYSG